MIRPLVLYHQSCADGACAAWVAQKAMPDAELVPCQKYRPAPDVKGREVYCVDFSFPRAELLKMKAEAASLLVLDHHKTAKAELEGLDFCTFDMERSGARLAWDHFFPWQTAPNLVQYVEDRDLWRWKLLNSKEVNAAIRSYPLTPASMAMLVNRLWSDLVTEGAAILRYQDELIESIAFGAQEIDMDGHKVLAVRSAVLQSELGEKLADGRPFGVVFMDTKEGERLYSLRSRPPAGIDVSVIAKAHGGGGHAAAAGFKVKLP